MIQKLFYQNHSCQCKIEKKTQISLLELLDPSIVANIYGK